jgi:hypothetical protein
MVNYGAVSLPFKKGYYEEIAIPTSVEVEGKTVDLKFGKQGNKADKLIVDKLSGKVTYEQWVRTVDMSVIGGWGITTMANQVETIRPSANFIDYLPKLDVSQSYTINKFSKTTNNLLDEQNFYTSGGWVAIRVDRNLLETQNVAGWVKWLQTQQDSGDPVLVNYALKTAITHDITNTDLGQSLLALATGKGTNYLEITSNLAPSQTDLSYWRQIIPNE